MLKKHLIFYPTWGGRCGTCERQKEVKIWIHGRVSFIEGRELILFENFCGVVCNIW